MFDVVYPITPQKHRAVTTRWLDLTQTAKRFGVELRRDGSFSGRATGKVSLSRDALVVEIESKPWAIPEFMIRSELKKMLDEFFNAE